MKYLIEVPDETGQAYYNIAPYTEPNNKDNAMWMDGYEKGVEAGRDDAWEFVMKCLKMDGNDFYEIFNSCDALCLTNLSYQEAKAKYESWKRTKEIRVGDEVRYHGNKYIVGYVGADEVYHIIDRNWIRTVVQGDYQIHKTGRRFDEVAELLKKMREEG